MAFPLKKILILENLKNHVNYGYNLWKFNRLMGIKADRSQFYRLLREMKKDGLIKEVDPDPQQPVTNRKTSWYDVTEKGLGYVDGILRELASNFIYLTLFDQIDVMEQLISFIEQSGSKSLVHYMNRFHSFKDVPHLSMFSTALQKTDITAILISDSDVPPDLAEMIPGIQILPKTLQPVSHSIGTIFAMGIFSVPIEKFEDLMKRFESILDCEKGYLLCGLPIRRPEKNMFPRFDRLFDLIGPNIQPFQAKKWMGEKMPLIRKYFPHSKSFQIGQMRLVIFSKNEGPINLIKKYQDKTKLT